jgi:phage/plasmid-associated DNA primase
MIMSVDNSDVDYERSFNVNYDFGVDSDSEPEIIQTLVIQENRIQPIFQENTMNALNQRYSQTEDYSNDDIYNKCRLFIEVWNYNKEIATPSYIESCMNECGLRPNDLYNQSIIYEKFKIKIKEIKLLKFLLSDKNLSSHKYDDYNTYDGILSNLIIVIGNAMHLLLSLRQSLIALKPNYDTTMTDDQRILSVRINNGDDMKDGEILIRYTLAYIQRMGYRKYGEDVYKPIYHGKYFTHAWARHSEIAEMVHNMVDKDENSDIWKILYTTKSGYNSLINYLHQCKEYEFPELVKDRTIFSYKNGVYNAREHCFYNYKTSRLSSDVVSCKYFDMDFEFIENKDSWKNIPTPSFQSILDSQFIDEEDYTEICNVAYILIGRLLYDVGDKDDWQVIPFFKGFAMTGKSTILKYIVKNFYEAADVGILSNECADKFPVENLHDKKVFISLDINEKFSLPQMTFQSMISGEDVSIMRKHKVPLDIEWIVPGAMAGNEFFGYKDNGGSIGRRIILFEFMNALTNAQLDNNLAHKIKSEIAVILMKCNMAYHCASRDWPRQNIWANLPKYFHLNRAYLLEQTNSLLEFLNSDLICFGSEEFIHKDEFVQSYMNYCKEHGLKTKKFNKDYYSSPFAIAGNKNDSKITVKRNPTISNIKRRGNYVVGVSIKYSLNLDGNGTDDETLAN